MTPITEERMQVLLHEHAAEMRKTLEGVLSGFAQITNEGAIAAQKVAEEGPTRRLRDNLAASFFGIRLKAIAEGGFIVHWDSEVVAGYAVRDADALLTRLRAEL